MERHFSDVAVCTVGTDVSEIAVRCVCIEQNGGIWSCESDALVCCVPQRNYGVYDIRSNQCPSWRALPKLPGHVHVRAAEGVVVDGQIADDGLPGPDEGYIGRPISRGVGKLL